MSMELIVKAGLIALGILLAFKTIRSLAKRTITESFSLLWGLLSVIFVVTGIWIQPKGLGSYISMEGLLLVILAGSILIFGLYYFSIQISVLQRKNQEMAIQISLLNQENEQILKKLEQL